MRALERQVAQLITRVRDLEAEISRLRALEHDARSGWAEAAIVSIESGNSVAAALGNLSSGDQTISSGVGTVMELVDVSGTLKLRPIQNSSAGNRLTLTYWNPNLDTPVARTPSGAAFVALRMRDGRWIRVSGSGASARLFLTTSTITARTGTSTPWTPGSGTGTMLEFYDDSGTLKVRTTSTSQSLRHMSIAAVASGRVVQCKMVDGQWLVDVDYC